MVNDQKLDTDARALSCTHQISSIHWLDGCWPIFGTYFPIDRISLALRSPCDTLSNCLSTRQSSPLLILPSLFLSIVFISEISRVFISALSYSYNRHEQTIGSCVRLVVASHHAIGAPDIVGSPCALYNGLLPSIVKLTILVNRAIGSRS